MQELSMNILDIAENSVKAKASLVEISLEENSKTQTLRLEIKDNGTGMSEEMLSRVTDPFCTSRTTRKVGLGLPFLKMAAEMADGSFEITSKLGTGTTVKAQFSTGHIDLAPLGDIAGTIATLVQGSPDIDFVFSFTKDETGFSFDTREAREILEGIPFSEPQVALFVRDYIKENMDGCM